MQKEKKEKNAPIFSHSLRCSPTFETPRKRQSCPVDSYLNASSCSLSSRGLPLAEDFAIYIIAQRQPAPPSSPVLLALIEPLPPDLPAPSASSSSKSAGLTVMCTTLAFCRAKGRSGAEKIWLVEFVAINCGTVSKGNAYLSS